MLSGMQKRMGDHCETLRLRGFLVVLSLHGVLFHVFSAVTRKLLGDRELADRQDDAERKDGVHEDFQDATAFFFGTD